MQTMWYRKYFEPALSCSYTVQSNKIKQQLLRVKKAVWAEESLGFSDNNSNIARLSKNSWYLEDESVYLQETSEEVINSIVLWGQYFLHCMKPAIGMGIYK